MIKKYSLSIAGHATSITLEPEFWMEIKSIAAARNLSIAALITEIDRKRGSHNLSSALRIHVLQTLKDALPRQPL